MQRLWPHLIEKKLVIFDYNGTILYDLDICVEALNTLMEQHGLNPISVETYRNTFYFPVKSFYSDMGFDFDKINFNELSRQYHQMYNENLHRCGTYEGIFELVMQLKENNIKTAILTALNQNELLKQIPTFGLHGLFDATFGLGDFNAHGKLERGRELMAHMQVDAKDTILIGDTTHDAEVAHELGIDVLLLDDGHQTTDRLHEQTAKVTPKIRSAVFTLQRNYKK